MQGSQQKAEVPHRATESGAEDPFDDTRFWLVHCLVLACTVIVGLTAWPTESSRLEARTRDFLSAAARGDAADAYRFVVTSESERMRQRAWWSTTGAGLAQKGFVSARIDTAGQLATVIVKDRQTQTPQTIAWTRADSDWYIRYDDR